MSSALKTALIRGAIGSIAAGALNFLIGLSQGQSLKVAGIAGGIVFLQYLIQRGGIEGYIDTQAASKTP